MGTPAAKTESRTYGHRERRRPSLTEGVSLGFVHDYLLVMRGAERTFSAIADCQPGSPIYTLLYDLEGTQRRFSSRAVHTSYLQRLDVGQSNFRRLMPLFPHAAAGLPVMEHDVVVSSSSAFAHGVRPRADALHVCYCHSPFRYAWFESERAIAEVARPLRPPLRAALRSIRQWDRAASRRVTHYIANSELSRRRIQEVWGRDAQVIHPPVDVGRFKPGKPEDFFLVVTELVPHKRVDLALEAARRAGRHVKVVGTGPELARLRATYGSVADFMGRISDDELDRLYCRAMALIVPGVEEFGIAAVEAQASGRPVVGADAGGLQETVIDGETGVLVPEGDVDALAEALRCHDFERHSARRIRRHARRFSTDSFKARFVAEMRRLQGLSADPRRRRSDRLLRGGVPASSR